MIAKPASQGNRGTVCSFPAADAGRGHLNQVIRNSELLQSLLRRAGRSLIIIDVTAAAVLRPTGCKDAFIRTPIELVCRRPNGVALYPSLYNQHLRVNSTRYG